MPDSSEILYEDDKVIFVICVWQILYAAKDVKFMA